MQNPQRHFEPSEHEKKIKCGFCCLKYAYSDVQALLTSKVLVDTYTWVSLMG